MANSTDQAPSLRPCPNCDGQGWTVVAKMRSRTVHGPDGEPEQRWEPEPEQEQCDRCMGTGSIDPAGEFTDRTI